MVVGVSFAWLAVEEPSQWRAGVTLYMLGLIAYRGSMTFWTAAFPGLAPNFPEILLSRNEVDDDIKTSQEHRRFHSLARNQISNVPFAVCSAGELIILAVMIDILRGMHSEQSTGNNTKAFGVLIAFSGGVWLLCALPWFFLEKRHPGLDLLHGTTLLTIGFRQVYVAFRPPGITLLTIGFKQVYVAFRDRMRSKHTFLYLVFYFLMGDVLNTTLHGLKSSLSINRYFKLDVNFSHSGVASMVFLYLVDVDKSHQECNNFIVAESKWDAFTTTILWPVG
ncbi:hypothetical protein CVT25_008923 [Psilocybe cyanescens]|uniref:Autophagy-related protein n=1 Tax=Psilocybe cyanescens TaxID=93625 RepID=A0A409XN83_PSICY|nr:hypothetical protein CVT25_008923 [Psilocybe cyanescens]